MTFPGASIIECWVCCEGDLAAMKEVRPATKITYLSAGPRGENHREVSNPFLFVFHWLVNRFGVGETLKVLVQALGENARVLFFESLTPFEYEFDLWAFDVRHWDEAVEGGLLADPEAYYISTSTFAAATSPRAPAPPPSDDSQLSIRNLELDMLGEVAVIRLDTE